MKDRALELVRETRNPEQKLNRLREYLQVLALRSLHESEAFRQIAFVGGTALRFIYGLPRFSEDLDFSLVDFVGYAGKEWMAKLKRDLALAGFEPQVSWNDRKAVHTGWVGLSGILREAGLSPLPEEKLSIKIEIDTSWPPEEASLERRIVSRHLMFFIQHYDLPSLLSGKLCTVIARRYAKGRDWYDLFWYLSQRPPVAPNLPLLQNSLDQAKEGGAGDARSWRALVRDRLASLDIKALLDDVRPFMEKPGDAALLTRENLLGLLKEEGG